jgi:type I restriction enzyme S subunit
VGRKLEGIDGFYGLTQNIRRMIYTTNPVEALHRVMRKVTKAKGAWVSERALLKQLYLALQHNEKSWKRKARGWKSIQMELVGIYNFDYPSLLNQRVGLLKSGSADQLNNKFFYYYLSILKEEILRKAGGVAQPNVSTKAIGEFQIPLPPLPIQKKIAAILDAASAYQNKTKALIEKYDELTQSLFLEMFGDVVSNNRKWKTDFLGKVTSSRLGKMLDKKKQTGKNLKPYLRNANVKWFNIEFDELQKMDFSESEQNEFRLEKGDVLVCEGGEVGRAAIWKNQLEECYFQKALHRIRVDKKVLTSDYLVFWFKEMAKRNGFKDYVSSVTIPHLTGIKLKSMQITLPPIELQKLFSRRLSAIESQKNNAEVTFSKSEELFQSLLQRAFKGELIN